MNRRKLIKVDTKMLVDASCCNNYYIYIYTVVDTRILVSCGNYLWEQCGNTWNEYMEMNTLYFINSAENCNWQYHETDQEHSQGPERCKSIWGLSYPTPIQQWWKYVEIILWSYDSGYLAMNCLRFIGKKECPVAFNEFVTYKVIWVIYLIHLHIPRSSVFVPCLHACM